MSLTFGEETVIEQVIAKINKIQNDLRTTVNIGNEGKGYKTVIENRSDRHNEELFEIKSLLSLLK